MSRAVESLQEATFDGFPASRPVESLQEAYSEGFPVARAVEGLQKKNFDGISSFEGCRGRLIVKDFQARGL